jgi:ABC-type transporter lipoprotein component MlaA
VLAVALGWGLVTVSLAHAAPAASIDPSRQGNMETVILPKSVADPIEPLNRIVWNFNQAAMTGVIKPTSKVYRFVVVKPV